MKEGDTMEDAKWQFTLSTTKPYNNVGLIQIRKGNINSETILTEVTQRNIPYDLSGLKVYFCAYFDRFIPVEQEAQIINPKKGLISYTLNQYDMQGELRFAYFKFEKDDLLVGTTQNFCYTVISNIESQCMDAGPYIQRLEDVLNLFANVKEESMKEIQEIIDSFNEQVLQQQENFDAWFESVKSILESIDPGGLLLSEIVKARGEYDSLDKRLETDKSGLDKRLTTIESVVYRHTPSGYTLKINHDNEAWLPEVVVTSYKNAIGVEKDGLGTAEEFGGGEITKVTTGITWNRGWVKVEIPLYYTLDGEISIPRADTLLVIQGVNVLQYRLIGAKIISGEFVDFPMVDPSDIRPPKNLTVRQVGDDLVLRWERE